MNTLGLVFYLRLVKDDSNVRRDSSLYLSKKFIATPSPYFLILSETQRTQGREREREVTNKTSSVVLARGQDSKGTLLSGWWKLSSSLILLEVFIYSLCIAKTCTSLWTQTSAGQPISPESRDSAHVFRGQTVGVQIPASPPAGCVVLDKSLSSP